MDGIGKKIKNKLRGWTSISFQKLKNTDEFSKKQYGIARTEDGSKINEFEIELKVARHMLNNGALVGFAELSKQSENEILSSDIINRIKGSDGKNLGKLIQEAQNELFPDKEGVKLAESAGHKLLGTKKSLEEKTMSDDAKKLYAFLQVAKELGAEFEVRDGRSAYRKELVIYIDPNCEDPKKAITSVMKGLGINSEDLIKDTINRFNKQKENVRVGADPYQKIADSRELPDLSESGMRHNDGNTSPNITPPVSGPKGSGPRR